MKIIEQLQDLHRRERECTVSIVEALLECDRTKAHIDLGYANLWTFLVDHLAYSKAAASRRLRAVRCAQRFPVVLTFLREGRVALSTLSKIAGVLDEVVDIDALLAQVEGRKEDEVDALIAALRPIAKAQERVKHVFVVEAAQEPSSLFDATDATEGAVRSEESEANDEAVAAASDPKPALPQRPSSTVPAPQKRVALSFTVTAGQFAAFERARAILSRKTGRVPSLEESLAELVGVFLVQREPKVRTSSKRKSRRRDRAEGESSGAASGAASDVSIGASAVESSSESKAEATEPGSARNQTQHDQAPRSRHIPRATRDQVLLRDGQQCTYVGPTGCRCEARSNLHIDHIRPFALGGGNEAENLRVLCAAHNGRLAERTFGPRARATGERRTDSVAFGAIT